MVKTRTVVQTRTHAQKYFQKLAKAMHSSSSSSATASGVPGGASGPSPHGINASSSSSGLPLPSTLFPSQGSASNGHTPFDLLINHQHDVEREKAAAASSASKLSGSKHHSIPSSIRKAGQTSVFPTSDLTFLSPDVQNGRDNPFPQPPGYYDMMTNHNNSNSQQYFPLESEELRPSSHSQSSLLLSPSLSPSLSSASTPLPSSSHLAHANNHNNNPYDVPSLFIPPNTLPSSGSSFLHTRGVGVPGGGAMGSVPDFPQPSPAACGKRKHAELAAAQILIGSASHHHQNSASSNSLSLETEGVNVLSAMKRDHNDMMNQGSDRARGGGGGSNSVNTAERDLPTSAMKRLKPLNLTVVFPNEGKSSVYDNQPQTPWENELKAFSSKSSGLVINLGMNTPSEQRSVMERLRKCVKTGNISELEEILKTLVNQHYSNQQNQHHVQQSGTLADGEQPIESNLMDSSPILLASSSEFVSSPFSSLFIFPFFASLCTVVFLCFLLVSAAAPPSVNKIPSKLIKLLNHVSSKASSSNPLSDHHLPLLLEPFRYSSDSDGNYDNPQRSGGLSLSLSVPGSSSATKSTSVDAAAAASSSTVVSLNEDQILDFIKLLLEYGSSISICDGKGNTALHYAAMNGYDKIGKYLLNKGCSVNYQNNDGNASVHLASLHGHAPFLEMLASLGENLFALSSL
jgi:hypothetical protein